MGTLCRIWECWLLDGTPKVFFRTALALFKYAEDELMSCSIEEGAEILKNFPPPWDQVLQFARAVPTAWTFHVTNKRLRTILSHATTEVLEADRLRSPVPTPLAAFAISIS